MANNEAYPIGITADEAARSMRWANTAREAAGLVYSSGRGEARSAQVGTDYGWPLLRGNGAPNSGTAASVGQHYYDIAATAAPFEWVCVGAGSGGYLWTPVGAGTSAGIRVQGTAPSAAMLPLVHPNPQIGDAYAIGSAAPYDIYVWGNDGTTGQLKWISLGPVSGTPGVGVPPYGAAGQALFKLSSEDYNTAWEDLVLQGSAAPNASVAAAYVGQIYLATAGGVNRQIWVCAAITGSGSVWLPVQTELVIPSAHVSTAMLADGSVNRNKLARNALYSPGRYITSPEDNIEAEDLGRFLFVNYAGDVSITLTQSVSQAMGGQDEVAVCWYNANSITIVPSGVRVCVFGQTGPISKPLRLKGRYQTVALKRVAGSTSLGDSWVVTGDVEVIA